MIREIFGTIFGRTDRDSGGGADGFPWIHLQDTGSETFFEEQGPGALRIVFKHSGSCGLSGMMLHRFENTWPRQGARYYFVEVRRDRGVSDALARTFDCRHQSPQVLVIRGNALVAHASHGDIDGLRPEEFL